MSKKLNFEKFKLPRNKTVELIKVSKKVHFREYFENDIKNSKEIWKSIRNLKRGSRGAARAAKSLRRSV